MDATTVIILERLAHDNRKLAKAESDSPHGIDAMRLYYLGKAQAYEIAADTVRNVSHD